MTQTFIIEQQAVIHLYSNAIDELNAYLEQCNAGKKYIDAISIPDELNAGKHHTPEIQNCINLFSQLKRAIIDRIDMSSDAVRENITVANTVRSLGTLNSNDAGSIYYTLWEACKDAQDATIHVSELTSTFENAAITLKQRLPT